MTLLTKYITSFIALSLLDYFIAKSYKKVGTVIYVGSTIITIIVMWFLFQYLFPDTYKEDVVRLSSMGLFSEIILYFAICKYNILKEFKCNTL